MTFNVSEVQKWELYFQNTWNEVELLLFEKLTTESIKGKGKHMRGKLTTWKDCIKTNFHNEDIPYDMYCNAIIVLKVDSV